MTESEPYALVMVANPHEPGIRTVGIVDAWGGCRCITKCGATRLRAARTKSGENAWALHRAQKWERAKDREAYAELGITGFGHDCV